MTKDIWKSLVGMFCALLFVVIIGPLMAAIMFKEIAFLEKVFGLFGK